MRIYHGWIVVLATAVASAFVSGMTSSSFGLFVLPVSAEFGLSRANMNTAIIIASVGNATMAPIIGRLADTYSNKLILAASAVTLGVSFVILGLSHLIWLSIFSLAVLWPIGQDGTTSITLNNMVARWFRKQRVRAMAFAALGLSSGGVILPPLVALLIDRFGWRVALIAIGVSLTFILLFFAWLLRERPGPEDVEPGTEPETQTEPAAGAPDRTLSMGELMRSPPFWMLMVGASSIFGITSAVMISLIPIGTGSGLTPLEATSLISVASVAGIAVKLALAFYGDRFDRAMLMILLCVAAMLMNIFFLISLDYVSLLAAVVCLGVAWGAMLPVMQTLIADLFGPASFGTARGLFAVFNAIFNASCARLAGEIYDRSNSYHMMFLVFLGLSALTLIVVIPLQRHSRAMRKAVAAA